MTSQEIFKQINPLAMKQQEDAQRLQDAITGMSKQNVVTQAIASRMVLQPTQPSMPQSNPQGWGSTQA